MNGSVCRVARTFKLTDLHGGALWGFLVGHDTLMLLWGLWCLRGADDDVSETAR